MLKESIQIIVVEIFFLLVFIVGWLFMHIVGMFWLSCMSCVCIVMTFYFFRDPERIIIEKPGCIISPADGKIVEIKKLGHQPFFNGSAIKISIYLTIWDVHINRIPISGKIISVEHHKGQFIPAFLKKAVVYNEKNLIKIKGKNCKVLVNQIAGVFARRIVCILKAGDLIRQGDRFGMIRFGSRVEITFPASVVVNVSRGEKVRAGSTVIGLIGHEK